MIYGDKQKRFGRFIGKFVEQTFEFVSRRPSDVGLQALRTQIRLNQTSVDLGLVDTELACGSLGTDVS